METKALAEIRQHLSKFVDEAVKPTPASTSPGT